MFCFYYLEICTSPPLPPPAGHRLTFMQCDPAAADQDFLLVEVIFLGLIAPAGQRFASVTLHLQCHSHHPGVIQNLCRTKIGVHSIRKTLHSEHLIMFLLCFFVWLIFRRPVSDMLEILISCTSTCVECWRLLSAQQGRICKNICKMSEKHKLSEPSFARDYCVPCLCVFSILQSWILLKQQQSS